jgi:hypothetical protein
MAKHDKRKEARGKECKIRIPGRCNWNPETTVLCHYRLPGYCGTGLKPDDDLAAHGCSGCHDCVDGRTSPPDGWTRNDVLLSFCEGVMRTWMSRKGL